ncbi:hypothetical protein D3C86_2130640 [compost metagenome]
MNSDGSDWMAFLSHAKGAIEERKAMKTASRVAARKPRPASFNVGGRLVASWAETGTPACSE